MALLIGIIVIARGLPQNHMRLNRATTWTGAGTRVLSRRHQTNEAGWRWPWTLLHTCASSARTNASHAQGGNSVRTAPQQQLTVHCTHDADGTVVSPRTGGWVSSAKRLPARRSPLNPKACARASAESARARSLGVSRFHRFAYLCAPPKPLSGPYVLLVGSWLWYGMCLRSCKDAIRAPPKMQFRHPRRSNLRST